MLVVEIDEKRHVDRDPDYKKKRQKDLEKFGYYFIRINPEKKKVLMIMKDSVMYVLTLLNQLKNKLKNQLKNHCLMIFQKDC